MTDERVLTELKRRYPEYDDRVPEQKAMVEGSLLAATLGLQYALWDMVEPIAAALTRLLTRR